MPLQMSEADSTSPDVLLLVSGDSPLLTLVLLPQTVLLPWLIASDPHFISRD